MATNVAAIHAVIRCDGRRDSSEHTISSETNIYFSGVHKSIIKDSQKLQGDTPPISRRLVIKESETHGILPYQKNVFTFYQTNKVQIFTAALIFSNFFVSSVEAEIVPVKGSQTYNIFYMFEVIFAHLFLIELIINLYGSWFIPFWNEWWNWFDFIIIVISILSIYIEGLPGISVLRLFRAFRVFRLFKLIPSLKQVINGILASLPGVANAFVVMTILMGIWAVIGVEFYGDIKDEEFGTFMKAMFSLWQVMSMDSWASGIARSIIYKHTEIDGVDHVEIVHPEAMPYFVSYLMAIGIIMMNVVVAILLDNYLEACVPDSDDEDDEDDQLTEEDDLLDRITNIDNEDLIDLVKEVMPTNVIRGFNRENLDEIFSVLLCDVTGHQEVRDALNQFKLQKELNIQNCDMQNWEDRNN